MKFQRELSEPHSLTYILTHKLTYIVTYIITVILTNILTYIMTYILYSHRYLRNDTRLPVLCLILQRGEGMETMGR